MAETDPHLGGTGPNHGKRPGRAYQEQSLDELDAIPETLDHILRERLSCAYSNAFLAIAYVTDPARWPGFVAFLEQKLKSEPWTDQDRLSAIEDGRIIGAIAKAIDPEGG